LPRLANRVHALPITGGTLAFAIACAMLLGWAAEALGGMAAITGAFIAGLCISQAKSDIRHTIEEGIRDLNYGLLMPIFFISIGLKTDLRNLQASVLPFALALFVVAVLSKILGGGLGARLGGFNNRSALRVGAAMVSRGEVGLIIGSVGLQYGLIPSEVFPEIVLVIIATTIVTPPLVRWVFQQPTAKSVVEAVTESV